MKEEPSLSFESIYSKHSDNNNDIIKEPLIKEKPTNCFYNCYLYLVFCCCRLEYYNI
jgi:hypothetical protein